MRSSDPHTSRIPFSFAADIHHSLASALRVAVAVAATAGTPSLTTAGQDGDTHGDACAPGIAVGDARLAVGGQYRLMGNGSNFGFHDRHVGESQRGNLIGNQRFRTWLNVHDRATGPTRR